MDGDDDGGDSNDVDNDLDISHNRDNHESDDMDTAFIDADEPVENETNEEDLTKIWEILIKKPHRTLMLEERGNMDLTFQFNQQQKQEEDSRILAEALPLMEGKRKQVKKGHKWSLMVIGHSCYIKL